MKTKLLIVFCFLLSGTLLAQSSIQGFTVYPASPTTADNIIVYADLQFPAGPCPLDSKGHSTIGSISNAYTHHCLGMLTVICPNTDTFNLGYLPSGTHWFMLTLTSGYGPPGCSPGIVIDDFDSTSFYVSPAVGINSFDLSGQDVIISPNPFTSTATITLNPGLKQGNTEFKIFNILGETVRTIKDIQSGEFVLNREGLPDGIYFYQLTDKGKIIATNKFIIE